MTDAKLDTEQDAATSAMSALLDRSAITRAINDWGLFRDTGRWDQLRQLFAKKAIMQTSWFVGPAQEFVDRSIEAKKRGARAQHFVGAATIEMRGDRAIAETRMVLRIRAAVGGVPVDVSSYSRFYDRLVREQGQWRFLSRIPVYERDRIDAIEPGQKVPLDPARLAQFVEAYRHLAYVQSLSGATLTPGLCTAGSAEDDTLCAEGTTWLNEGR